MSTLDRIEARVTGSRRWRRSTGIVVSIAVLALATGAIYVCKSFVTTYVFIGTPDSRWREEVFKSSLVMRLVRALPGVDIRIVADPSARREAAER